MNINCVSKCKFQQDGKCVMDELPASMPDMLDMGNNDCPYCQALE